MSASPSTTSALPRPIPLLLLKTRSHPHDVYEDHFATAASDSTLTFRPAFIPVLEHTQNKDTLAELGGLLRRGELKHRYGGMIFTSQRAVEAWAEIVFRVEEGKQSGGLAEAGDIIEERELTTARDSRTNTTFQTDITSTIPFPLYVVGPATSLALATLLQTLKSQPSQSTFLKLNPSIHGSETGSGAILAPFILSHYNTLHAQKVFTYHDAPRLPFIPLLGMGSENYSRRRLSSSDPRLQKSPLLFLVGETRRDIIPKTLMDEQLAERKVDVHEVEVYRTDVRGAFRAEFDELVRGIEMADRSSDPRSGENPAAAAALATIVIFSPQGSGDMLKAIGYIDEDGRITNRARKRWTAIDTDTNPNASADISTATDAAASTIHERATETKYVIVTIGPTTRDYLRENFGIEPDVCAKKPSPEGVRDGLEVFLRGKGLV